MKSRKERMLEAEANALEFIVGLDGVAPELVPTAKEIRRATMLKISGIQKEQRRLLDESLRGMGKLRDDEFIKLVLAGRMGGKNNDARIVELDEQIIAIWVECAQQLQALWIESGPQEHVLGADL